ncbi:anti-sigma factor domain-containing protein [Streptomyces sp. NPDC059477]|uniref:anti-sigma factor n=1 Tax=Streptomyces sp. NPDC059477 TaxID=3346847 RepID=UPI0036B884E0
MADGPNPPIWGPEPLTDDPHRLTGAYALDALDGDERVAFERHLTGCAPCAQESAELCATAARLGLAASAVPRPEMRARVLRRITTVRQVPPRPAVPVRPERGTRRARASARWALAACLAVATALGGTAWWQYERARDAENRVQVAERAAAEVAAVLSAPDARVVSGSLGGDGATGRVVVSRSRDRAVFVAAGLPRPPTGKTYQLWFDDGGVMRDAGLLDAGRADQAVLMGGVVGRASGMGITVEPEGGSARPTSVPLAVLAFA